MSFLAICLLIGTNIFENFQSSFLNTSQKFNPILTKALCVAVGRDE